MRATTLIESTTAPRSALRAAAVLCAAALLAGLLGVTVEGAVSPSTPAAAADPVPGGLGFTAITPCRVADTRAIVEATPGLTGTGGRLVDGGSWVVQVDGTGGGFATQGGTAGGCGIPAGVSAVEISVTVVDPIGTGYLRAHAGNAPVPTATFINYSGQSTTNTGTVPVAPGQFVVEDLRLTNFGAQTHVIVDVQGYYTSAGTLGYVPLASPCRAGDTRLIVTSGGQKFGQGSLVGFKLTGATSFTSQGGPAGGCGVPDGVTAVELSLTAITPEGNGFLRLQAGLGVPTTTFLNFAGSIATTNTGTTRIEPLLGTDITVQFFGGKTHVAVDIQGYFTSAAGSARYQTVTPCRVLDTRAVGGPAGVGGPFPDGVTRHLQASGELGNYRSQGAGVPSGCGVPQGAAAIEASLTAVAPTAAGFTRPYPVGGTPTGTFLNLSAGRSTTNTGSLGLGARGMDDLAIKHFGGSSHYLLDVFGYFVSSNIVFPTAESVDAGGDHTCALMTTSGVHCWGEGDLGRLGRSGSAPFVDGNSAQNVLVGPSTSLTGIAQLSVGGSSACALTVETEIQCWGSDSSGQLGDTTAGGSSSVAVFVRRATINGQAPAVTGFAQVSVGGAHACALSTTGTVSCWGENGKGQLGVGDTNDSATPRIVNTNNQTLTNAVQVVAGREHTCALIADGTARCWGSSENGQLGHGEGGGATFKFVPQTVRQSVNSATPLGGIVELAAGARNTCALLVDSTVRCWGDNSDAQLGNSKADLQVHPAPEVVRAANLAPLTDMVGVALGIDPTGFSHHACALAATRQAWCWGANEQAQLARGSVSVGQKEPGVVQDASFDDVLFGEITLGGRHSCGIAVGTVPGTRCWGDNTSRQLGAGLNDPLAAPSAVAGL